MCVLITSGSTGSLNRSDWFLDQVLGLYPSENQLLLSQTDRDQRRLLLTQTD